MLKRGIEQQSQAMTVIENIFCEGIKNYTDLGSGTKVLPELPSSAECDELLHRSVRDYLQNRTYGERLFGVYRKAIAGQEVGKWQTLGQRYTVIAIICTIVLPGFLYLLYCRGAVGYWVMASLILATVVLGFLGQVPIWLCLERHIEVVRSLDIGEGATANERD